MSCKDSRVNSCTLSTQFLTQLSSHIWVIKRHTGVAMWLGHGDPRDSGRIPTKCRSGSAGGSQGSTYLPPMFSLPTFPTGRALPTAPKCQDSEKENSPSWTIRSLVGGTWEKYVLLLCSLMPNAYLGFRTSSLLPSLSPLSWGSHARWDPVCHPLLWGDCEGSASQLQSSCLPCW